MLLTYHPQQKSIFSRQNLTCPRVGLCILGILGILKKSGVDQGWTSISYMLQTIDQPKALKIFT